MKEIFEKVRAEQESAEYSSCPRYGTEFDVRRGAVSRRIPDIMICDLCGQQEAIEDFLKKIVVPVENWYVVKNREIVERGTV